MKLLQLRHRTGQRLQRDVALALLGLLGAPAVVRARKRDMAQTKIDKLLRWAPLRRAHCKQLPIHEFEQPGAIPPHRLARRLATVRHIPRRTQGHRRPILSMGALAKPVCQGSLPVYSVIIFETQCIMQALRSAASRCCCLGCKIASDVLGFWRFWCLAFGPDAAHVTIIHNPA